MTPAEANLATNAAAASSGPSLELKRQMAEIGRQARKAARVVAAANTEQKNRALKAMAFVLRDQKPRILKANAEDVAEAQKEGMTEAFIDRLTLNDERVEAMAVAMEALVDIADPVGTVLASWERPNGLKIDRVRTPLGVIGVIYESRPNVTADAAALCIKAGNAVILRGGSDSFRTSSIIHYALTEGLQLGGLPATSVQLVPTRDRDAVGLMLGGLNGNIDVIVPRGGKSLVQRVQDEARVPVLAHLEGVCHVYVDRAADLEMAKSILINSKMRRTGICGAAETLLVDRLQASVLLEPLVKALREAGCEVRGDEAVKKAIPDVILATEADWSTEYLDAIISVKLVAGLQDAMDHIEQYGSHHTETIVTRDVATARRFMERVDSAIVMHNASTQFADGGEFGMGAEIGIGTGKLHARGPIGVEQLTTFKYMVRGNGQIRP